MKTKTGTTDRFVPLSEIASELGASRASARRWLEQAGVTAYAFGTGRCARLSYRQSDLDDWLASCAEEDDDEDDDLAVAEDLGEELDVSEEDGDLDADEEGEDQDEDLAEDLDGDDDDEDDEDEVPEDAEDADADEDYDCDALADTW